ncbi:MAG TPA: pyrroline-5-carboxylate reductase [Nitrospirota bacterium]|nr:pyrroline-5-carboxylate reductase [Nitrospirota bacterium]
MAREEKIAFLGGGNMAEALIKGVISAGTARPEKILVADVSAERLEHLRKNYSIVVQKTNTDAAREAGIIILSVKPQAIEKVLAEIAPVVDGEKLVVSIAAGISLSRIEHALKKGCRVVRVMPNTPALVLAGVAALAAGNNATSQDVSSTKGIFDSVGRSVVVDEKLMDAVTGLSGSGPAYVFTIIDALSDAGVKAGLPRQLALELAAQTVYGSAKMVLETKEHPAKLRDMVTSPGGTTIEGLHALEKGKLRATLMNAVEAATARSKELGK